MIFRITFLSSGFLFIPFSFSFLSFSLPLSPSLSLSLPPSLSRTLSFSFALPSLFLLAHTHIHPFTLSFPFPILSSFFFIYTFLNLSFLFPSCSHSRRFCRFKHGRNTNFCQTPPFQFAVTRSRSPCYAYTSFSPRLCSTTGSSGVISIELNSTRIS